MAPVISANGLIGDVVSNIQGEDLGKLEEVMIDLDKGCVAYAVLSFGGHFGFGDKLFAIPWEALVVEPERKRLLLNVSREQLANADGFDKFDWPDMADPAFRRQLRESYNLPLEARA